MGGLRRRDDSVAYQKTMFDRLGPDAGDRVKLVGPSVIFMFLITIGCMRGGLSLIPSLLLGLLGAVLISAIILLVIDRTSAGFMHFIWPSGSSTPYEKQYSLQESLAIRGDVAGAIASYEEIIAGDPKDVEARIRAAELLAGKGNNAAKAADMLRDARKVEGISAERDLYISNRLVDLLRGPLRDEGRALVELRRLVHMHPASRDAQYAREAIAKMKTESVKDPRDMAH